MKVCPRSGRHSEDSPNEANVGLANLGEAYRLPSLRGGLPERSQPRPSPATRPHTGPCCETNSVGNRGIYVGISLVFRSAATSPNEANMRYVDLRPGITVTTPPEPFPRTKPTSSPVLRSRRPGRFANRTHFPSGSGGGASWRPCSLKGRAVRIERAVHAAVRGDGMSTKSTLDYGADHHLDLEIFGAGPVLPGAGPGRVRGAAGFRDGRHPARPLGAAPQDRARRQRVPA